MTPEEQRLVEERLILKQTIEYYERNPEVKRVKSAGELVQQLMMIAPSDPHAEQKMKGFPTREEA